MPGTSFLCPIKKHLLNFYCVAVFDDEKIQRAHSMLEGVQDWEGDIHTQGHN